MGLGKRRVTTRAPVSGILLCQAAGEQGRPCVVWSMGGSTRWKDLRKTEHSDCECPCQPRFLGPRYPGDASSSLDNLDWSKRKGRIIFQPKELCYETDVTLRIDYKKKVNLTQNRDEKVLEQIQHSNI